MSTIFRAHATRVEGTVIEVRVYIVHPHQFQFYDSRSFALQLLAEFIESVELLETSNHPIEYEWDSMTESEQDALFEDESKLASALYRIEVTRPEWVEGVSPGLRWDSAAADLSNYL